MPTAEPLHASYNWQAVTPVTETSSRYYFSWGVRRSENRAHVKPIMNQVFLAAFEEDRQMIEQQQRIWTATTDQRMFGSTGDLGLNRMRQVIQRLLVAEQGDAQPVAGRISVRTVAAPESAVR